VNSRTAQHCTDSARPTGQFLLACSVRHAQVAAEADRARRQLVPVRPSACARQGTARLLALCRPTTVFLASRARPCRLILLHRGPALFLPPVPHHQHTALHHRVVAAVAVAVVLHQPTPPRQEPWQSPHTSSSPPGRAHLEPQCRPPHEAPRWAALVYLRPRLHLPKRHRALEHIVDPPRRRQQPLLRPLTSVPSG
jgi:hypothetical protein